MVVNHTPLCDAIVALYRSIRRGAGGEYRRVSSSSVCARGRGATVARVVASRDEEEIDGPEEMEPAEEMEDDDEEEEVVDDDDDEGDDEGAGADAQDDDVGTDE